MGPSAGEGVMTPETLMTFVVVVFYALFAAMALVFVVLMLCIIKTLWKDCFAKRNPNFPLDKRINEV